MENEQLMNPEELQALFFDRPVDKVAQSLAEVSYTQEEQVYHPGNAKLMQVGDKSYLITVAQVYHEDNASHSWNNKRMEEIRDMKPGEMIAYGSRAGVLSFIKTNGANNILIRELRDVETGEIHKNAKAVSLVLGLTHGQKGKLTYSGSNILSFRRSQ